MANFIKHTACDNCGSSDGLAHYDDESKFCFVCQYTEVSQEYKEAAKSVKKSSKEKNMGNNVKSEFEDKPKSTKPVITEEDKAAVKAETSIKGNGFRGISDETYKAFGVRHAYDAETGEVIEQYYPVTQEGLLTGYKVREVPKKFYSKGRTGADCDMFMQFKFNRGGKYVVITEGEICALSAYQMLSEYNRKRGSEFEIAVVSPTTGAQSKKQIANNYKFFDSFDIIVLAYDSDKAGQDASEEVLKVLPKGKVRLMKMRYKDHNEYLEAGKDKEYIRDFYDAKAYVPVGVLPSGDLYERIISQSEVGKVPFPPFMKKLNDMFVGGMPLGYIFNIAADTGIGKTTYVNEMIYYWVFNSPHTIGIVSMELDAGQYGEVLLSRHISRKLSLMDDQDEKIKLLQSEKIREKAKELTINEDGNSRFYLLDNRDGSVEEIQDTIEELVVACGCKIIICDPLQDVIESLSNEEQAMFMKWAKGFIKSHGITFVFINHMRKGDDNDNSEQRIMGSSTIIKSAAANIILKRDKLSQDETVRNTTTVTVTKNRICGLTGPAGATYYDNQTHTLHDLDSFLNGEISI